MGTRVGGVPQNPKGPGARPQKKPMRPGAPQPQPQPQPQPGVPTNPGAVTYPTQPQPQPQPGTSAEGETDSCDALAYQSLMWHARLVAQVCSLDDAALVAVLREVADDVESGGEYQ